MVVMEGTLKMHVHRAREAQKTEESRGRRKCSEPLTQ